MVTRKMDVLDAMMHNWREWSKMNMLTRGIHIPVKQKFPNNLFSGSYRQVQMSTPHRAACLAGPLCANVVSSLQEGICMVQIREAHMGEHKGTLEKLLLPRNCQWFCYPCLHLTCPELQHLGQQQQEPL